MSSSAVLIALKCSAHLHVVKTVQAKTATCPRCSCALTDDCQGKKFLRLWTPLSAHMNPGSLVIRRIGKSWDIPSTDTSSVLHVGITDSKGTVWNFDVGGVLRQTNGWEQCVVLNLGIDNDLLDRTLAKEADHWTKSTPAYHAISNNCFDFVVHLLNKMNFNDNFLWTKISLCDRVLNDAVAVAENSQVLRALLDEGAGWIVHEAFTEFSCTLTIGQHGRQQQFEHAACPICFDYGQARLRIARAFLKGLGEASQETGDDYDMNEDSQALSSSWGLAKNAEEEEMEDDDVEDDGQWE
eukprot:m.104137 g.104137  ORF g.104137 m.104137 type:complete len:297 (-) comp15066_c0_seq1:179-1069(-)